MQMMKNKLVIKLLFLFYFIIIIIINLFYCLRWRPVLYSIVTKNCCHCSLAKYESLYLQCDLTAKVREYFDLTTFQFVIFPGFCIFRSFFLLFSWLFVCL